MQQENMPILQPIVIPSLNKRGIERLKAWFTNRRWLLMENFVYPLAVDKIIIIPAGFEFDGASVPKPFHSFISPTGLLLIPSLLHDFGYRYNYFWLKTSETTVKKQYLVDGKYNRQNRRAWDQLFYNVSDKVNGFTFINTVAATTLSLAGCCAWKSNQRLAAKAIVPAGYAVENGAH